MLKTKNLEKNKKVLDKQVTMCYNKDTKTKGKEVNNNGRYSI